MRRCFAPMRHPLLYWNNDTRTMNPLELYKKLPKKNCGKCSLKTCMPFALAVVKGDADLAECPLLAEAEIADIRASLVLSDWREELILKLREEVGGVHFNEIAEGLGAEMEGDSLVLRCFGREFRISPDGEITTQGRMTPWIKILILHYLRTAGTGPLSGKHVSFGELRGGMVKASSFERECEEPLRELFEKDYEKTARILDRMGTNKKEGFPTRHAWELFLLPKVPLVVLYWPPDEEFPAKVKMLFDATADKFLDVESLIFLVEGLVKNVEMSH
jgi:hypothetical protein